VAQRQRCPVKETDAHVIVTVFRARVRAGIDEAALTAIGARMAELAPTMPGFVSYKDYAAEDGEGVTIVEFDTLEHQLAWRMHPEHQEAQKRAREEFFSEYRVTVCERLREVNHTQSANGTQPAGEH
jgi:heme-degrading monooxygenase HmoA